MDNQSKTNLAQSLRGVVNVKWFLLLGLFFLEAFAMFGRKNFKLEFSPLYYFIGSYIILNILYYYFLNIKKNNSETILRIIKSLQVIIDPLFFTVIVYYSGGISNHTHTLYFISIIIASILYEPIIVIADLFYCSTLFAVIVLVEHFGYLPHMNVYLKSDLHMQGGLESTLLGIANIIFILWIVGILSLSLVRILRRREEQLIREKDKTKSTIESLIDGLIMFDQNLSITIVNKKAEEIFKIERQSFEGKRLSSVKNKANLKPFFDLVLKTVKTKKEIILKEMILKRDDGKSLTIQTSVVPVLDKYGQPLGIMQTFHDISREKAIDAMKSEFITIAAHQLRTPLSGTKWMFNMILDGNMGKISKKVESVLRKGSISNERMISLVNDLLNISKIEEGKFGYAFKEESLEATLDDVVVEMLENNLLREKQIEIVLNKPKNKLPLVKIDKNRIEVAFHNLIDNAIKYSNLKTKITIDLRAQKKDILISVKDQGMGIPESEQSRIFSKFFRGTNIFQTETTGSGLGLFITRNIIHAHGGQISFTSKVGEGTTFNIMLPFTKNFVVKKPNPEFQEFLKDF
ncbi:MAG: ATP-binding protein [Patescibacteria group bacterium]